MNAKSYRIGLEPGPSGFRTPSPPPFESLNPISPTTSAWSAAWALPPKQRKAGRRAVDKPKQNGTRGRKRKSAPNGAQPRAIDNFAPPGLSNRKTRQPPNLTLNGGDDRASMRPSKRAKSEHIAASEEPHSQSRPHTSYHAQNQVQTADAELLLNFSREATNASRSPWLPPMPHSARHFDQFSPHSVAWTIQLPPAPKSAGAQYTPHQQSQPQLSPSSQNQEGHAATSLEKPQETLQMGPPTISVQMAAETKEDIPEEASTSAQEQVPILNGHTSDAEQKSTAVPGSERNQEHDASNGQHRREDGEKVPGSDEAATASPQVSKPGLETQAEEAQPAGVPTDQSSNKSPSICAGCNFHRNSLALESENEGDSWISCDGCKSWFHFACAGFKNEREVRSVDKFRCRQCKSTYGPTTYVRKSARAHSAIDYAGLNEGIVKTSDDNPLHHYIKPIKDGTIKFDPETFARIRPELITRDFFEKGDGMREPVVIPAEFNPRPSPIPDLEQTDLGDETSESLETSDIHDISALDDWRGESFEFEQVDNYGQDALDMVIPIGLTVRKVAELYGPDEKIDVIDVKSQNGEDKKWTMRRWADYYESTGNKKVRNVISLEVSQSKLGRLIQRPKIVRDLDLQDSVWPADLIAKGDYPKVQFYCLMSVADCYTDFHIDFGGSSVYYHILQGKKTFFFIPPYEKHLKKYEEWCNSPAQNWTFLGDQTKECYRVDLSAGDTMLIPAGWIHAVWTPEDSLVIGGNFLTRLNLPMQIRVTQIEKATFVDRKFRYPHFQKVMWYTALHYLEQDPIPDSVVDLLLSGQPFVREVPTHLDFDGWGDNSTEGPENYHCRYYPKSELDGLPELGRYLQRTALIAMGHINEGITTKTQEAVKRSIPKVAGDPLQTIQKFAMWYTWKRGDETIPHWAYPEWVPEVSGAELAEKKMSAKAMKKLDREAALQAWKVAPDRQSTRVRSQPQTLLSEMATGQTTPTTPKAEALSPLTHAPNGTKSSADDTPISTHTDEQSTPSKKSRADGSTKTGPRRPACEVCRRGRRACKHRDEPNATGAASQASDGASDLQTLAKPIIAEAERGEPVILGQHQNLSPVQGNLLQMDQLEIVQQNGNIGGYMSRLAGPNDSGVMVQTKSSGRSKACKDCRKSKRRCVHDENGNEDPVKLAEAAIPRPAAKKRKQSGEAVEPNSPKRIKKAQKSPTTEGSNAAELEPNTQSGVAVPLPEAEDTSPTAQQRTIDRPAAVNDTAQADQEQSGANGDVHLSATSPISEVKYDVNSTEQDSGEASNGHARGAGSLVSPPESTHTEHTPPAQNGTNRATSPVAPSTAPPVVSRQKATPRYTPDSNAQRRASTDGDATSPTVSTSASGGQRRQGSRMGSDHEADEESLKLIRELAAQDMGLRRRAKV